MTNNLPEKGYKNDKEAIYRFLKELDKRIIKNSRVTSPSIDRALEFHFECRKMALDDRCSIRYLIASFANYESLITVVKDR